VNEKVLLSFAGENAASAKEWHCCELKRARVELSRKEGDWESDGEVKPV
jgi:hypothetical protein